MKTGVKMDNGMKLFNFSHLENVYFVGSRKLEADLFSFYWNLWIISSS